MKRERILIIIIASTLIIFSLVYSTNFKTLLLGPDFRPVPAHTRQEATLCGSVKNPTEESCGKAYCTSGYDCEFTPGGIFTSAKCECNEKDCDKDRGFVKKCGEICCKEGETCCVDMCCDAKTPEDQCTKGVIKVSLGLTLEFPFGFCQPSKCPPPNGDKTLTKTCSGTLNGKFPLTICCPEDATCGIRIQTGTAGVKSAEPYCIMKKCPDGSRPCAQVGKDSGADNSFDTNGVVCCPDGTECIDIEKNGLGSKRCSAKVETCDSQGKVACKGREEFASWTICCPSVSSGSCRLTEGGVPGCVDQSSGLWPPHP